VQAFLRVRAFFACGATVTVNVREIQSVNG
jgi:hypothetical protein